MVILEWIDYISISLCFYYVGFLVKKIMFHPILMGNWWSTKAWSSSPGRDETKRYLGKLWHVHDALVAQCVVFFFRLFIQLRLRQISSSHPYKSILKPSQNHILNHINMFLEFWMIECTWSVSTPLLLFFTFINTMNIVYIIFQIFFIYEIPIFPPEKSSHFTLSRPTTVPTALQSAKDAMHAFGQPAGQGFAAWRTVFL